MKISIWLYIKKKRYKDALAELNYLLENDSGFLESVSSNPMYDPLRTQAGYREIIKKYEEGVSSQ